MFTLAVASGLVTIILLNKNKLLTNEGSDAQGTLPTMHQHSPTRNTNPDVMTPIHGDPFPRAPHGLKIREADRIHR